MVIEIIPHGVIPYKCGNCKTVYLWKPSVKKEFCEIRVSHPDCTNQDYMYYKADMGEVRCPVCKLPYGQKRIGDFRYKLIRALNGKLGKWE